MEMRGDYSTQIEYIENNFITERAKILTRNDDEIK